jgi:hypothetical protein
MRGEDIFFSSHHRWNDFVRFSPDLHEDLFDYTKESRAANVAEKNKKKI